MKHRYLILLAAPAMAGLLFTAGCDDDDTVGTTPDRDTGMDTARTAAGTEDAATDLVPDAQIEQFSQMLDTAKETAAAYKDKIAANVEIEGWGTGTPASEMLDKANEKLDAVQAAVKDRDWTATATNMRDLMAMPMPADLKQQVQAIADKFKSLNVPALRDLGTMPDTGIGDMPTAPGVPAPGEPGSTPPAGGGTPPNGGGA